MSGASKQGNEGKPTYALPLLHILYSGLIQELEIAKGHTDASATTRLTAGKDAISDKVDEKKHDVSYSSAFPTSKPLRAPLRCRFETDWRLPIDEGGCLRQQVGIALSEHHVHSFSPMPKGDHLRPQVISMAGGYRHWPECGCEESGVVAETAYLFALDGLVKGFT